jgi:UDP-4-amino-4,6-dideoxy-N-acetyl-beta-L-altrosamine transaminase
MIPYGKQDINQQDIDAVIDVLKSDYLTQGPVVPKFEQAVSSYVGAQYGVAVNSATSALHIACLALDVGKGDVVWTSPISFVASANCALYCGADIDFVDIDEKTYNLSASKLEEKLLDHKNNNKALPKVVIPVHLAGQSCDMGAIHKLGIEYGFKIIEDASHAIGASYQGYPVGNCRFSDITVFSFHPVKIITTAEGGLATTNDSKLADKMRLIRSHGVTRDPSLMTEVSHGSWYYQQIELGFNYRMTELQAALGLSQLERLTDFVERRSILAEKYNHQLEELPLTTPFQTPETSSSWHLYIIQVDECKHKAIFEGLREKGIGVNLHYIPIHLQPFYSNKQSLLSLPISEDYYKKSISIPLFHTMTDEQQSEVIYCIKEVLK